MEYENFPCIIIMLLSAECSINLVNLIKFIAYPDTLIVSWGYSSGCSIAWSRVSLTRTFTFKWQASCAKGSPAFLPSGIDPVFLP